MKFQIKNRWSGAVQYECELSGEIAGHRYGIQLGVAIRSALKDHANLTDADLTRADLTRANLTRADLTDANLTDADLTRANLTDANLTPIRDDLWAVLSSAPAEVAGLLAALREGRVDGSTYEGDCACLVGTLANLRGVNYLSLKGLQPNSDRPIERFFMSIRRGDTPETNQFSKLAAEWTDDWLIRMQMAFGAKGAGQPA